MVRNITIKLGYANAKIYQGGRVKVEGKTNDDGTVEEDTWLAGPYTSRGSSHPDTFQEGGVEYKVSREGERSCGGGRSDRAEKALLG